MAIIQGNAVPKGASGFYPKTIDQSLRFEDGDSAYLTLASGDKGTPTDVDKCTISVWLKRGELGRGQTFMFAGTLTNNTILQFDTSDKIFFSQEVGGTKRSRIYTSALFRDTSAWYHIVFAYDSSEAVAADRAKLWVNGVSVEFTDQTDEVDSDRDNLWFSDTQPSYIGNDINLATHKFSGYMAEYHGIDGQALDHTSFGELKSGIWVPKEYSGTYGTNGFHLALASSDLNTSGSAITDPYGSATNVPDDAFADASGSGNHWSINGLVASDIVPDSPTNNFATLNNIAVAGNFSEGNLKHHSATSVYRNALSTLGVSSGKWYAEFYVNQRTYETRVMTGVALVDKHSYTTQLGADDYSWGLIYSYTNSVIYKIHNGVDTPLTSTGDLNVGDVVMVALDLDNNKLWFGENGTWLDSGDPAGNSNEIFTIDSGTYVIGNANYDEGTQTANFGQDSTFAGNKTAGGNSDANGIGDFQYTVPSGYLALCTANLPDPVFNPAEDVTPEDHFNVVTYSGNSSSLSVTGVGFEPDFTWIKNLTSTSDYHTFFDKVRGTNGSYYSFLLCPYTGTEDYASQGGNGGFGAIETFDTDGFTLDSSNSDWSRTNESGQDYVAYNWSLPTTVSGSTAGVGTSKSYTGRVNADAGVSIIAYTGNNDGGHRIPHHLNEAPELVICKGRTYLQGWPLYHKYIGLPNPEDIYLELNNYDSRVQDDIRFWNDTQPDSTHVTLGTIAWVNQNDDDYVMYCFHSVDGFSKVGSYVGNGSTDGTFVYTGFKPKWIMAKRVDSSVATADWYIWDAERNTFNVAGKTIQANETSGESDSGNHDLDILSNGFKLRIDYSTVNGLGNDFSYLAFAEQPFKYSNAR